MRTNRRRGMVLPMLRVMAVDNDARALAELAGLLRRDPRIEQVFEVREAAEALRALSRPQGERVDAVFLDVRMAGLDGIDFARLLSEFVAPPLVVFVTSREDQAVAAFDLGVVHYLLKPVRPDGLAEAVRRLDVAVRHRAAHPECSEHAGDAVTSGGGGCVDRTRSRAGGDAGGGHASDEQVPVELGRRIRMVPRANITYATAHGDYVRLHTAEGSYLVRTPLATLARRWESAGFIRIHRSTLVAARHISELRFDGGRAVVQVGDEPLAVSRRYTRRVRELLVRYFDQPDQPREPDQPGQPDQPNPDESNQSSQPAQVAQPARPEQDHSDHTDQSDNPDHPVQTERDPEPASGQPC